MSTPRRRSAAFVVPRGVLVLALVLACGTGLAVAAPPATAPAAQPAAAPRHEEQDHGIGLWRLVGPAGALTLALVIAAVGTALLRRLRPRPLLKVHKVLGVCALISACVHALLVFLSE